MFAYDHTLQRTMSAHLFTSAIRARDEKRFEDAITILTTLIDSDPTHMDKALRARSYTHRGNYKR